MILAIETATDICSVAFRDDAGDISEKRADARGSHSEKLFLFIRELMKEQQFVVEDLSGILISKGPGSYTGLRIAASGVKGLLFDSDISLYSVSTLASFATAALENNPTSSRIHAIIDARRVHVYHQGFSVQNDSLQAEREVETVPIETFEKTVQPDDIIVGTGLERLEKEVLKNVQTLGKEAISAQSLIRLYHQPEAAQFVNKVSPAQFDPDYYSSGQL